MTEWQSWDWNSVFFSVFFLASVINHLPGYLLVMSFPCLARLMCKFEVPEIRLAVFCLQLSLLLPSFLLQISSWCVKRLVFVISFYSCHLYVQAFIFPYSTYCHASKLVPIGSVSMTFLKNNIECRWHPILQWLPFTCIRVLKLLE